MALEIGARGTQVKTLQKQLKAEGFNPGTADGVFGVKTQRAVEAFQRAKGLKVDGQVGEETTTALRRERNTDAFEPTAPATGNTRAGADRTAQITHVSRPGQRNQLATGNVTVNGHTYNFRSGGFGKGSLPPGAYTITPHLWNRSDRSMNVGGVGYSFAMSDKFDPRVGATRRLLRIHPDGGTPGTEGCMGIVGDAATQRRFREDMRAELNRNGGRFTLNVG